MYGDGTGGKGPLSTALAGKDPPFPDPVVEGKDGMPGATVYPGARPPRWQGPLPNEPTMIFPQPFQPPFPGAQPGADQGWLWSGGTVVSPKDDPDNTMPDPHNPGQTLQITNPPWYAYDPNNPSAKTPDWVPDPGLGEEGDVWDAGPPSGGFDPNNPPAGGGILYNGDPNEIYPWDEPPPGGPDDTPDYYPPAPVFGPAPGTAPPDAQAPGGPGLLPMGPATMGSPGGQGPLAAALGGAGLAMPR